ncbi:hypothetical protein AAFF_G00067160 [Aldrovandia affinis]|uniref:Radiation-inducible immediate-early gene IEX-1 n=1 Tax=Aldrovandia affinis TaxID=143900 RepID=A0AAD7WYZ8_9TELE|nr:hypothetical protein AAFF_G00067160 [Aldrovandia affinis]
MILSLYANQFDHRPTPRSQEPEIFTFDQLPARVSQRNTSVRHRRKNTRVMYPATVRKYLPPAEKSPAKRWLLALCLVVFLQIYTEEPCVETGTPSAAESPTAADVAREDPSFAQYRLLPFQSAEQQVRRMRSVSPEAPQKERESEQSVREESVLLTRLLNWTCPCRGSEVTGLHEQSRRNGYVVALLYPVYHTLGGEK